MCVCVCVCVCVYIIFNFHAVTGNGTLVTNNNKRTKR